MAQPSKTVVTAAAGTGLTGLGLTVANVVAQFTGNPPAHDVASLIVTSTLAGLGLLSTVFHIHMTNKDGSAMSAQQELDSIVARIRSAFTQVVNSPAVKTAEVDVTEAEKLAQELEAYVGSAKQSSDTHSDVPANDPNSAVAPAPSGNGFAKLLG